MAHDHVVWTVAIHGDEEVFVSTFASEDEAWSVVRDNFPEAPRGLSSEHLARWIREVEHSQFEIESTTLSFDDQTKRDTPGYLTVWAGELVVGDSLVNLGVVVAHEQVGAFEVVRVEKNQWSLVDGKAQKRWRDLVYHQGQDVLIFAREA